MRNPQILVSGERPIANIISSWQYIFLTNTGSWRGLPNDPSNIESRYNDTKQYLHCFAMGYKVFTANVSQCIIQQEFMTKFYIIPMRVDRWIFYHVLYGCCWITKSHSWMILKSLTLKSMITKLLFGFDFRFLSSLSIYMIHISSSISYDFQRVNEETTTMYNKTRSACNSCYVLKAIAR